MSEPLKDRSVPTVEQEVVAAVARVTGFEESDIKPDMLFVEDLGCQSLQIMEIILELQSVFDVEIPDEDIDGLRNVSDAVSYLRRRLQG
jgi:acyl carrier protein